MGDFEGKYYDVYAKLNYWDYDLNNDSHGVETIREILSRTRKFLDKIQNNFQIKQY